MSQPWIRLYRSSLHNPKLVCLPDRVFRAWHNCLLIADDDGTLPSMRDISVHMRCTATEAEQLVAELVEAHLVDPIVSASHPVSFRMHGWGKWQRKWDCDPTNAERQKRARQKKRAARKSDRNGERNGAVTGVVTATVTENPSVSVSVSVPKTDTQTICQKEGSELEVEDTREGARR